MRGVVLVGTAVTRPAAVGTLYRQEHGDSWSIVTGIPENAGVQAITPHPSRANVVYAATRKGVFVSLDDGLTWTELGLAATGKQFWTVVVHPRNHHVLFAGTSPVGFYRSDDEGRTWRMCQCDHPERFKIAFGGSRVMRIAFHPTDPNIMYAAAEINGFLVSTDGGESWRAANDGVIKLADDPKLKSREVTDDDTEGMFDGHSVCTSPAIPDTAFYACRMGVFSTTDLGKHMNNLEVDRHAPFHYTRDVRVACDDPRTLYACFSIASRSNAGAMYRSNDLGETWARLDSSVTALSTIMGFGVHGSDPRGVVSVTRHGQVFYTLDGCQSWNERQLPANAGDAFCGAIV